MGVAKMITVILYQIGLGQNRFLTFSTFTLKKGQPFPLAPFFYHLRVLHLIKKKSRSLWTTLCEMWSFSFCWAKSYITCRRNWKHMFQTTFINLMTKGKRIVMSNFSIYQNSFNPIQYVFSFLGQKHAKCFQSRMLHMCCEVERCAEYSFRVTAHIILITTRPKQRRLV